MTDPRETFTSSAATDWRPSKGAGVSVKVLRSDKESGESAALLKMGDYLYTPPDGKHAAASDGGCVFLVTLPRPVVILKDA